MSGEFVPEINFLDRLRVNLYVRSVVFSSFLKINLIKSADWCVISHRSEYQYGVSEQINGNILKVHIYFTIGFFFFKIFLKTSLIEQMATVYMFNTLCHISFYLKFKCSNISLKLKPMKHLIESCYFWLIKHFFSSEIHIKLYLNRNIPYFSYLHVSCNNKQKKKHPKCQSSCFDNPCRPLYTTAHSVMDPAINTINIHTQSNSKGPNIII